MFNSYFLNDFKIEVEYSKIQEICLGIMESTKKQVVYLDLMKINNKPIGFIMYQIDSPESDWCQKDGLKTSETGHCQNMYRFILLTRMKQMAY